jgi:hypothetical protein
MNNSSSISSKPKKGKASCNQMVNGEKIEG